MGIISPSPAMPQEKGSSSMGAIAHQTSRSRLRDAPTDECCPSPAFYALGRCRPLLEMTKCST